MAGMEWWMVAMALVWPALGTAAVGVAAVLGRRYVRAAERRGIDAGELDELRARLAALEASVDATRQDVDRLEASQDFTTKLLTDRAAPHRDR